MSFPDLTLAPSDARYHSSATGTPSNGNNTVNLGLAAKLDPNSVNEDQLLFEVFCLGPSVTTCTFVSYDKATGNAVLDFTQAGADQCRVECTLRYSQEW